MQSGVETASPTSRKKDRMLPQRRHSASATAAAGANKEQTLLAEK